MRKCGRLNIKGTLVEQGGCLRGMQLSFVRERNPAFAYSIHYAIPFPKKLRFRQLIQTWNTS